MSTTSIRGDSARLLSVPFRTIAEVEAGLGAIERALVAASDARGIFATAYLLITRELQERIAGGAFEDGDWVERYAVAFANLYREALWCDESKVRSPEPWRVAFVAASDPAVLVVQHLLLGINAHIAHDLPVALHQVAPDPRDLRRDSRHRDHTAINVALAEVTDTVQDRVCALYAPVMSLADLLGGSLDEFAGGIGLAALREEAWCSGVALIDAPNAATRTEVRRRIELAAAHTASLLLEPNRRLPDLVATVAAIESLHGGWADVLLGGGWASTVRSPATSTDGAKPLTEAISALEARISEWDRRLDERAAVAALFLDIALSVERTAAAGRFLDASRVEALEAACIDSFLAATAPAALPARGTPRCWSVVEAALAGRQTILVHDLALAVCVRVHHDLPSALSALDREGEASTSADRGRDLETLLGIVDQSLSRAVATVSERYELAVAMPAEIAACCARATAALGLGTALTEIGAALAVGAATSPAEMDRRATARVHAVFAKAMQRPHDLVAVLRSHEQRARGPWSGWIAASRSTGVLETALGERLQRLSPLVRSALAGRPSDRFRAHVDVDATPPLGWLGAALPVLRSRRGATMQIDVVRSSRREVWILELAREVVTVDLAFVDGVLHARFGILDLVLRADVVQDRLVVRSSCAALLPFGVSLPRLAAPDLDLTIGERHGRIALDLSFRLPLLGSTVLRAEAEAERATSPP